MVVGPVARSRGPLFFTISKTSPARAGVSLGVHTVVVGLSFSLYFGCWGVRFFLLGIDLDNCVALLFPTLTARPPLPGFT